MGRRPGPLHGTGTTRPGARHGGRHDSRTPLLSPRQLQRRPAIRAMAPPPPRPVLVPGAQDAGTPPPCGHVAELHPAAGARESSAPSRRALHLELPTKAEQTHWHRCLPLTLLAGTAARAPPLAPPRSSAAGSATLSRAPPPAPRAPVLPAAHRALSTARWPMCRVVGRRLGPWHGQARHGWHGRAACRADSGEASAGGQGGSRRRLLPPAPFPSSSSSSGLGGSGGLRRRAGGSPPLPPVAPPLRADTTWWPSIYSSSGLSLSLIEPSWSASSVLYGLLDLAI
jgi:hypothetical protein